MGSSYFGEPNLGNERSGSSRRGKKSSNSDNRPKQPQRGLGVAQLEKIRLHSQMGCTFLPPSLHAPNYPSNLNQEDMRLQTPYSSSSSFSYTTSSSSSSSYGFHGQQNIMMGLGELERANMGYGDSQHSTTTRWNPGNGMLETQQFAQTSMARHFLQVEDSLQKKRKKDRSNSTGSSSQNSETSDTQELDLELRLSL